MKDLTPRQIVSELDKHIVGQLDAKRAVAIAVRNRWRHQRVDENMRNEIGPKNILMIGPTGVGKTEIARRLAVLTDAPFIKVEATKYTEVGYYGRDVESMVRELVEHAIGIVRKIERENVIEEAKSRVTEQLVDLLLPDITPKSRNSSYEISRDSNNDSDSASKLPDFNEQSNAEAKHRRNREKIKAMLLDGQLEERTVSVTSESKGTPVMMGMIPGMDSIESDLGEMLERFMPKNKSRRELTVREAREVLLEQECDNLINKDKLHAQAIELAETTGIIFIDEIDKIVAGEKNSGVDVSRQGVQRDLLPIVEGTTVQTKYGYVKTDYVLFIAAGAFHRAKPSDLMPELQGRFPIRVELTDLSKDDFVRILTEPSGSLTKQYAALMETEKVTLNFEKEAINELANYAFEINQRSQNIGARRLYTIMEKMLDELSFEASEKPGTTVVVNADYVRERLDTVAGDEDLRKFIL
ncbi:MAG: ATP-dependent protease ATPase subunit HslU [Planctomycetaceae bacterium]|jgi:ATP-dependent HslUV protease ATP-binding subunit HslU|nr:ATP-dependent protease ATPase subunit HslU [Planctomycetaceae bacterium]